MRCMLQLVTFLSSGYKTQIRIIGLGMKTLPKELSPKVSFVVSPLPHHVYNFVKITLEPLTQPIIHFHLIMSFELANETITFKNLVAKIERVSKLQNFSLDSVTLEGDEDDMQVFTKFFRGHSSVESARFRNVLFADEGIDLELVFSMLLISTDQLRELSVEGCRVKSSVITSITYNATLDSIRLVNCGLTDDKAMKLVDALAKASKITSVDVSGNEFTDFGAHAFTQGLKQRTKVTSVQVDGVAKNGEGAVLEGSAQTLSAKSA